MNRVFSPRKERSLSDIVFCMPILYTWNNTNSILNLKWHRKCYCFILLFLFVSFLPSSVWKKKSDVKHRNVRFKKKKIPKSFSVRQTGKSNTIAGNYDPFHTGQFPLQTLVSQLSSIIVGMSGMKTLCINLNKYESLREVVQWRFTVCWFDIKTSNLRWQFNTVAT